MHLAIPSIIFYLIVYGALLGAAVGVIVLLVMLWKDWKRGQLW